MLIRQTLLSRSAREQVAPSISPPLCLFPARCCNGSINETTLKTKVQTLADASSPHQLFPVWEPVSQSAGRTTGSRHLRVSRRRPPRLMCYLERRKCDGVGWDGVGRGEERRTKEPNLVGETRSGEPGSVSESHGAGAPAQEVVLVVVMCWLQARQLLVLAGGGRGAESEVIYVFCSCLLMTSLHLQTLLDMSASTLSGCRKVKTAFRACTRISPLSPKPPASYPQ